MSLKYYKLSPTLTPYLFGIITELIDKAIQGRTVDFSVGMQFQQISIHFYCSEVICPMSTFLWKNGKEIMEMLVNP